MKVLYGFVVVLVVVVVVVMQGVRWRRVVVLFWCWVGCASCCVHLSFWQGLSFHLTCPSPDIKRIGLKITYGYRNRHMIRHLTLVLLTPLHVTFQVKSRLGR